MDDLWFDRLDVDGALAESLERTGLSRAAFLAAALGGSTALLGRRTTEDALAQAGSLPTNDVFILNYALVLEYLQAAFYTEAERMGALRGRTARAAPARPPAGAVRGLGVGRLGPGFAWGPRGMPPGPPAASVLAVPRPERLG